MFSFTRSTGLYTFLRPTERRQLDGQGYVVLERFLEPDFLRRLRDRPKNCTQKRAPMQAKNSAASPMRAVLPTWSIRAMCSKH